MKDQNDPSQEELFAKLDQILALQDACIADLMKRAVSHYLVDDAGRRGRCIDSLTMGAEANIRAMGELFIAAVRRSVDDILTEVLTPEERGANPGPGNGPSSGTSSGESNGSGEADEGAPIIYFKF